MLNRLILLALSSIYCMLSSAIALADQASEAIDLLKNKCIDCHTGDEPSGGFDLTAMQTGNIDSAIQQLTDNRLRWSHAMTRVKFQEMPPKDSDQLSMPSGKR